MQRTLCTFLIALICFGSQSHAAKEILLRLSPEAEAPVIAQVTASEKVILDTAPAPINAELGWRQLLLPTPFEGYVPAAKLSKNFDIAEGTEVHYLPTTESASITQVATDDVYEIVRVKEDWATVRFRKSIMGYFIDDSTQQVALDLKHAQQAAATKAATTKPQSLTRTQPTPEPVAIPRPNLEPVAIPAPRTQVNPDQPIAQLDPNSLPPENVNWQALRSEDKQTQRTPTHLSSAPVASASDLIMVPSEQTQAREVAPELGPAKTPRLLTGQLVRQISADGPDYPIRLQTPEGRLIAYVDFSRIYISDLAPYLNQKVYINGQIFPLPKANSRRVILAESLKLAP